MASASHQALLMANTALAALPGVSGLIGWWDTSLTASLNLTGATVNSIADRSGYGQTMVGNTHDFGSPTYSATGFNTSYPGILIDTAVGSALETALGFPMGTGNTLTFFFVGTNMGATANSDARYLSYCEDNSGTKDATSDGSWCYTMVGATRTDTNFRRNAGVHSPTTVAITNANHVVIVTVDATGAVTVYIDGVANSAQTGNSGNWVNGGALAVGNESFHFNSSHYGTLTASEWGVATGFSDATGVATLYSALKTKWGL